MRYVSIYPKSPNIRNTLERLSRIETHSNEGIGIRIDPKTAKELSYYKPIRELNKHDIIDIVHRENGPRRSIFYIKENVRIQKKAGKYYFFF